MIRKTKREIMTTSTLNVDMPYEGDVASITITTAKEEAKYPTTGLTLDREVYRDDDIVELVNAIYTAAKFHEKENPELLRKLREVPKNYVEEVPQVVHGKEGRLTESFGNVSAVVPTEVVAGIISTSDFKYLLVRSAKDRKWEFPGGKKEKGETDVQTALREIKEELGLSLPPDSKPLPEFDYTDAGNGYELNLRFVHIWAGKSSEQLSNLVRLNEEILAYNFLTSRELELYKKHIRESNRKVFEGLLD